MKKIFSNWKFETGNKVLFYAVVKQTLALAFCFVAICSYGQQKKISKLANTVLFNNEAIKTGHIGISIFEPATGKYWFNHNASQYFIPASNVKLFSLYTGMKYLGDSLVGAFYSTDDLFFSGKKNLLRIVGNGDPSFLHPSFKVHPVFDFLNANKDKELILCEIRPPANNLPSFEPLGKGWAWDDFNSDYMVERSFFPIYGNTTKFILDSGTVSVSPSYFTSAMHQWEKNISSFSVQRSEHSNFFSIKADSFNNKSAEIGLKTRIPGDDNYIEQTLLSDTLKTKVELARVVFPELKSFKKIHSQPSDSLFKPMMNNSDNFFAEQTLLMASNEYLGYMSEEKIIDTILKSTLQELPQKPKWVDGSGLSRYNLFTPQSMVHILNKMKNEFGIERLKNILPTGGEGTLKHYFKNISGFIYAKTGTLSNNCALSGYLITRTGKLLIFSVLANNYITGATPVRRAVENFLQTIHNKY